MDRELLQTRAALARLSNGKAVAQDAVSASWSSCNWGELLQPAPLSLALLANIILIASSTDDFSLLSVDHSGAPPIEWKYCAYPTSFKTCLQQLSTEGNRAFDTVHHNMDRIAILTDQMPDVIKTLVALIVNGSESDIRLHFKNGADHLAKLSDACMEAAQESSQAFRNMTGLASELKLASTKKMGDTQNKVAENDGSLEILQSEKEDNIKASEEAKAMAQQMRESFVTAEKEFAEALGSIPSGWDVMGMELAESLTSIVSSASSAFVAGAGMVSSIFGAPRQAVRALAASHRNAEQTGGSRNTQRAELRDPAITMAEPVFTLVRQIQLLLTGDGGRPAWDKMRSSGGAGPSGSRYCRQSLERRRKQLKGETPLSAELGGYVDTAIGVVEKMELVANSFDAGGDEVLTAETQQIEVLVGKLQTFITTCNVLLQQPALVAGGTATPPTPRGVESSAARIAVENSRFKVDQTRAQLEAARQSYQEEAKRLMENQRKVTETIKEISQTKIANNTLKQLLPTLQKAIKAFGELESHFSQLTRFFGRISTLLNDGLQPNVDKLLTTLSASSSGRLGGITMSAFTRNLIYQQMRAPLRISMLANSITGTYIQISDEHLLPAQRKIATLMDFPESASEKHKQELILRLHRAHKELGDDMVSASNRILKLVHSNQRQFDAGVDARLASILDVLPAYTDPIPEPMLRVVRDHVAEQAAEHAAADATNPMWNVDNMM